MLNYMKKFKSTVAVSSPISEIDNNLKYKLSLENGCDLDSLALLATKAAALIQRCIRQDLAPRRERHKASKVQFCQHWLSWTARKTATGAA